MARRRNTRRTMRAIDARIANAIRDARQAAGLPHYQPRRDEVEDEGKDDQRAD